MFYDREFLYYSCIHEEEPCLASVYEVHLYCTVLHCIYSQYITRVVG